MHTLARAIWSQRNVNSSGFRSNRSNQHFFFSPLWSPPSKMRLASPHWHLVLSLASTADSTLWWQVAGRPTLFFRCSRAQSYRVPLEAGTAAAAAAEADTGWLSGSRWIWKGSVSEAITAQIRLSFPLSLFFLNFTESFGISDPSGSAP